jgi:hypothetical protein
MVPIKARQSGPVSPQHAFDARLHPVSDDRNVSRAIFDHFRRQSRFGSALNTPAYETGRSSLSNEDLPAVAQSSSTSSPSIERRSASREFYRRPPPTWVRLFVVASRYLLATP